MAALLSLTGGRRMELHQLAFIGAAYAVPVAFFAALAAGMIYGIIRPAGPSR